jgi:lantibiotic modifying enzyme
MISQASSAVTMSVQKCEDLYSKLSTDDPWPRTQCGSSLAWGEAGVVDAILDLYEVTGDLKYLREVVRRGDRMFSRSENLKFLLKHNERKDFRKPAQEIVQLVNWIYDNHKLSRSEMG